LDNKNNRDLAIITGATRGLGKQLAISQSRNGMELILLGRDASALRDVKAECEKKRARISLIEADLSKNKYRRDLQHILSEIDSDALNNVYLFNNASVIEPINMLVNIDADAQEQLMQVNLNAPIWISSEFMRFSQRIHSNRSIIVNISSGVSLKPIQGWSLYCMSKAAMNMLTACIAEESKELPFKLTSVAINPGALDTDMQKAIRSSNEKQSPIAKKFQDMYERGDLKNVKKTALKIIEIVQSDSFNNGQYLDFNTL
jgi:benzil reductase ((S)-benzoin forming)